MLVASYGGSMKNILIISVIIVALIALFFIELDRELNDPKTSGRDTVLSLGDGTFQIMHDEIGDSFNLFNVINGNEVASKIVQYKVEKRQTKIYIILKDESGDAKLQYAVLNYKTGVYFQYYDINQFSEEDAHIFIENTGFVKPKH
jgi:hypothetical protein